MRAVRSRAWAHHVAHNVLSAHPFGGLRRVAAAAIDLHPYQLEPAVATLRHARLRILIADEVGLGKTIQAGILLNELAHAECGFRGVILSPAGLREQWHGELISRFSLNPTIADTAWLDGQVRGLPPDVNPWSLPGIFIASLDLVKRPEVLRAIEDVTWDLCIVDEAHGASPGTGRLAAAHAIGARSRRVLLLTATPPDSDPAHFDAMADIGRTAAGTPITVFRRTRSHTGVGVRRKTVLRSVRLTPDEQAMHRLLERYTTLVWREAAERQDGAARLAATVLRKRALSSAASLLRSVRRRLTLLGTTLPPARERQLLLPLDDEDPPADDVVDASICASGLADVALERACLESVAAAAERAAASESKLHWLRRLLRRMGEPAIVFTEYRDTLAQIAAFLDAAPPPLLLHGDLSPSERAAVQRAFNRSGALLIATDAASEGLNLHERCRVVIHFELPWTPMRLEQRTGRVDRLGQSKPVHEVLMVARDTAERLVLAPLLRRARIAAERTGRASPALEESRVADAILGGIPVDATNVAPRIWPGTLDVRDESRLEAERLCLHRRLLHSRAMSSQPRLTDTVVTVTRRTRRYLVVVRLTLRDTGGRPVHEEMIPVLVSGCAPPADRSAADLCAWAARLLELGPMTAEARRHATVSIDAAIAQARDRIRTMAEREREIATCLRSTARVLVQAGLFDRRAVSQASARDRVVASLLDESETRIRSFDPDTSLRIEPRVVAVRSVE